LLKHRVHEKVIAGTRYDNGDTYAEEMKKKSWKERIYPAEVDEKGAYRHGGTPVYLRREELDEYWNEHGEYIYNSQMGQFPMGEAFETMQRKWLGNSFYNPQILSTPAKPSFYLYGLVDAGRKQEKRSDYTAMGVIGTDCLRNYWLLDLVRDKIDNGQKWEALKRMVLKWGVIDWGYEHIGLASDREYMELRMQEEGTYFRIIELGGNAIKPARIKRLIPDLQRGRWKFPKELLYQDVTGNIHELINEFMTEEYDVFPYAAHDDILDMMSRIYDGKMGVIFPPLEDIALDEKIEKFDPLGLMTPRVPAYNWMSEA
jgi:phage terminase large subunit-like protein